MDVVGVMRWSHHRNEKKTVQNVIEKNFIGTYRVWFHVNVLDITTSKVIESSKDINQLTVSYVLLRWT